ncbi:hypothetical protein [Tenacibaculum jejuense]|uniref:hypothetical protein n=1 Tax=Tenacibaculum jejuense TaxID=584609 RepID=UPI0012FE3660|nr:hypothetical protein [Tenacibaculum jejuense]
MKKVLNFSPAILLILLVIYSFNTHENKNELEDEFFKEKKLLQNELNKIVADYKEITSKKKWLTKRVVNGMNKIIALKDSVEQLEKVNYDLLFKYSLKITKLERENRKLFLKVESLQKQNTKLRSENTQVKKDLQAEEKSFSSLVAENKKLKREELALKRKVNIAGTIEISSVLVEALKEKSNGKYTTTNRYKKTDAFRIKFDILPNELANIGNREIFVQILDDHNNTVPSEKSGSKNEISYNDLISIDYDREKISVVSLVSVDRASMNEGDYTVNVYIGKRKVGKSIINLR